MSGKEVLLMILQERGLTKTQLGNKLGLSRAAVWGRLDTSVAKDVTLATFNEMANALDYEVVLRPKHEKYVDGEEHVLKLENDKEGK